MKTTSILATGNAAIEIAETDSSVSLHKYSDPTEGAREDISIADARAIAREDAGLIYATRRNAASVLGSIGGSKKSPAKSAAARENGKRGGRPSYRLHDYRTGEPIRTASRDERAASVAAAKHDGGAGVIEVEGRSCYVAD